MATAYSSYQSANIETADQGKLILITYDCAIRNCKIAKEKIATNDVQGRNKALIKAQDAVTELMSSLNMNAGGEIAKNLYMLYDYMLRRLSEANIKKDGSIIDELLKHFTDLRESWVKAIENVRREKGIDVTQGLTVVA